MDEALYDEMFRLEQTHWWFVAKRRTVLSLLDKYVPISPSSPSPQVCDIGCGCGMTLCRLKERGYQAVGVDASDTALSYCAARGVHAVKGTLPDQLGLPPSSAEAVLMLDVLEHLDDDYAALRAGIAMLKPGGILIATVPAYQWLWTKRDEFHHHKRRYSMKSWRKLLVCSMGVPPMSECVAGVSPACGEGILPSSSPFLAVSSVPQQPQQQKQQQDAPVRAVAHEGETPSTHAYPLFVSYFNTFLFPMAAVARFAARLLPAGDRPGDMSIPPLGINRLLAGVFAAERIPLRHGISLPMGLSLLAVIQKQQIE